MRSLLIACLVVTSLAAARWAAAGVVAGVAGFGASPPPEATVVRLSAKRTGAPLSSATKSDGPALGPESDFYERLAYERHHRRKSVGCVPADWPRERNCGYGRDALGRRTAINQPLHRESEAAYLVGNGASLFGAKVSNAPSNFTDVQYWADQSAKDLFFEEIRYDARIFGGAATATSHPGLIQEVVKSVQGRRPVVESYGYDAKLRLSTFRAHEVAASDAGAVATHPYALHAGADYTYDELSRPVTTRPSGLSAGATPAYGQFDNLTYRYDAGGRPGGITDYASEPGGHPTGAAQTAAYVYNAASDIEVDPYRQLRYEYNALGLASRIYVYAGPKLGTESLYYYTAGGALVESKTYDATRALVAHVYYLDGHRYDAVRDEVYYATRVGATVLDANNDARHIRYHHDHLGNVVLAYSDIVDPWLRPVADGRIDPRYEYLEEQQYFPYGMTRNGYTAGRPGLPFAYNGAEYSDALDLHLTTYRTMALETGLWGQVDPKAELGYHFSPYVVNGANPISYNDPDGDWIHLAIGAVVGGVSGYIAGKNAGATGGKLWGYVAIGAGAGALSAGVGSGINAAIAGTSAAGGGFGAGFLGTATLTSTGFAAGAASGAGAGLVNGFATGAGYSLMGDNSIGNAFASGLQGGVTQAFGGAVLGGLTGGIDALIKGKTFWTGSEGPQVFKSPVSSNYGNQNGECVLRCLEEFSESYGDVGYDYNYWLKQNGGLGVASKDVVPLVNGSGRYTANAIPVNPFTGDVSSISSAFQSGKRVMMGLSTSSGGNHAVMVNKLKVWPSGRYRMFFSETSPTWLVPRSTSNIRAVGGSGFWQFFR